MASTPPMRIRGIDHVVLCVAEIERSLQFYTEVLGLSLERVIEDLGIYQLRCGDHLIDLSVLAEGQTLAEPERRGVGHVCISVDTDVDAMVEHLKHNGVPITMGPVELYGATGYGTSVYIQDPDAHTLELKARSSQWPVRTSVAEAMGGLTRPKG